MDDGLGAAHPRLVMTVTHAWQGELVTVADPHVDSPPQGEQGEDGPVVADGRAVVLRLAAEADGDAPVESTIHVEVRDVPHPRTARKVLYDHVLLTPRGAVAIGDREQEVLVPAHPGRTAVRVSIRPGDDPRRLTDVWVELAPDPLAD